MPYCCFTDITLLLLTLLLLRRHIIAGGIPITLSSWLVMPNTRSPLLTYIPRLLWLLVVAVATPRYRQTGILIAGHGLLWHTPANVTTPLLLILPLVYAITAEGWLLHHCHFITTGLNTCCHIACRYRTRHVIIATSVTVDHHNIINN